MNVIASFPPGKSDFERIVTFTSPPPIPGRIRLRLLGHSTLCSHSPRGNCNRQDGSFYGLSSVHSISSPVGLGLSLQTSGRANHSFVSRNSPKEISPRSRPLPDIL